MFSFNTLVVWPCLRFIFKTAEKIFFFCGKLIITEKSKRERYFFS